MNFQEMIGMTAEKGYLQKAISLGRVSHAYIFSAEAGYGKKTLAKAFAMALQCEAGGTDACGSCPSCKKALSGNHPDIIEVVHEKPNSIGVEEIREQINATISIKPYTGSYKVYIIPDAQKMTIPAQNALLKTIEEPPEYAVLLLLTTNEQELLPTIVSRCVSLRLRPIGERELQEYLMKAYELPDYKARICASFAHGNIGKGIRLATSEQYQALRDEVIAFVSHLYELPVNELIDYMKNLSEYKLEIDDYLDFMAVWYRDVLLFKATKDVNSTIFHDQISEIMRQADRSSYDGLERIIKALATARRRLAANVNFDLAMELLFLTIQEN